MKKLVFSLFAATVLALPICAQTGAAVATIPFDFAAGTATLPAGAYTVNVSASPFLATLVGPDRRTHILSGWTSGVRSDKPALIFHRYGNRYFLSEVRIGERSRRFEMLRPELELKKLGAAPRSEVIVLAMR
ncbi:MAG: hypothetical protein LAQ30_10400 [Acidobacteriia bacterium]|nr:hypothetical protein [Terriglobia bacterium]